MDKMGYGFTAMVGAVVLGVTLFPDQFWPGLGLSLGLTLLVSPIIFLLQDIRDAQ